MWYPGGMSRRHNSVLFVVPKQTDAAILNRMIDDPHMAIGAGTALCGRGFDEVVCVLPKPYDQRTHDWVESAVRTRLFPRGKFHG